MNASAKPFATAWSTSMAPKSSPNIPEVASNLYIRVLQDLERHPEAALIVDLSGDPEASLKALEKVTQAAPDLYVIASNYHADGETVIASVRGGCRDFLVQPVKRLEFREAMTRLERTPRRAATGVSRLGKVYTFLGAKGGAGTTTLAVNFAGVLAQRKKQTVSGGPRFHRQRLRHADRRLAATQPSGSGPIIFRAWIRRCSKGSPFAIRWASI